jgi:ABC-2 type transport system ATP-binding protein
VRSLRDSGTTILLTTHYMEEAQALADRVAVLSDGQVVAQGTLADIGGRASAQTQIRFALPAGCLAADLPAWARPAVEPTAEPEPGDLVTVAVSEPTRALHELTTWALHRGLVLDQLTVEPPSLEDVYLRLTGPDSAARAGEKGADDTRTGRKRARDKRADRKQARERTTT